MYGLINSIYIFEFSSLEIADWMVGLVFDLCDVNIAKIYGFLF